MLVSPPQDKMWHGRLRKSGEKQRKLRHYLLLISINKYFIVIITVHRHHIRTEKKEWKTLEINVLVKMINVITGIDQMDDSNLCSWSFIIWIFWQNFPCFSVSAFTVSLFYENMLIFSENSQSILRFLIQEGS